MVLALYGVALLFGLWKMYKPRGFRLPEFKEDNLTEELPDSPIVGDMAWRAGAGWINLGKSDPEEIDDYRKAVEKYNKRRKEKKD